MVVVVVEQKTKKVRQNAPFSNFDIRSCSETDRKKPKPLRHALKIYAVH